MSINVNNPFNKISVDEVFIVHPILIDETYSDLFLEDRHIMDVLVSGKAKIDVYVEKIMKAVILDKGNNKYIDIVTGKTFYKDDEIKCSYEGKIDVPYYKYFNKEKEIKRKRRVLGFTISIKELARTLLHKELPNEMSIRAIIKVLNEINSKEKDKNTILLSKDKIQAAIQLSNIVGIETDELIKNDKVKEILSKIINLCSNNPSAYDKYVKDRINEIINKYYKNLDETKPSFKRNSDKMSLKIEKLDPQTQ